MRHTTARKALKRSLKDTCVISEPPSSQGVLNESTYDVTFPDGAVVYQGKCKIFDRQSLRLQDGGFEDLAVDETGLKIPVGSASLLRVGQLVTVTPGEDSPDQAEVLEFTVGRLMPRTHKLSDRLVLRRRVAYQGTGGT